MIPRDNQNRPIYNNLLLLISILLKIICKKSVEEATRIKVLQSNLYFDGLNRKNLAEIIAGMRLYRFERGEIIFWEGDECAGLHMIRQGSVKLFKFFPKAGNWRSRFLMKERHLTKSRFSITKQTRLMSLQQKIVKSGLSKPE